MITVFSGSNRRNSRTSVFAKRFYEFFCEKTDEPVHFLSLENLPLDICHPDMYSADGQSTALG